jgi:hypothetical protein
VHDDPGVPKAGALAGGEFSTRTLPLIEFIVAILLQYLVPPRPGRRADTAGRQWGEGRYDGRHTVKHILTPIIVILGLAGATGAAKPDAPLQVAMRSGSAQSLRFTAARGYSLGVLGEYWGQRTVVTFVLQQGIRRTRLLLQATQAGTFLVGIRYIDLCTGGTIRAQAQSHSAMLRLPPRACPPAAQPPTPLLIVLRGRKVHR